MPQSAFPFAKSANGAEFSPDRMFRYVLTRQWDESADTAAWIGLNPSTADEVVDDATMRRIRGFCKAWGYGGFVMLNIFAYRATVPEDMKAAAKDGVDVTGGAPNDDAIRRHCAGRKVFVCWGSHGGFQGRSDAVMAILKEVGAKPYALRVNADSEPAHPLYLPSNTKPSPYWRVRGKG